MSTTLGLNFVMSYTPSRTKELLAVNYQKCYWVFGKITNFWIPSSTQWAAVNTCRLEIIDPPQVNLGFDEEPFPYKAIHGQAPSGAGSPPKIRSALTTGVIPHPGGFNSAVTASERNVAMASCSSWGSWGQHMNWSTLSQFLCDWWIVSFK